MPKEKKPYPCPEFGAYLRELRKEAGYTQESFADAADFDRTYVSGVERGERNVSLVNICRFADALRIHPSKLFEFYKSENQ
ncbi:helix-turn-helix domain-containing protein [Pseudoteredinibacter isoporae]|uniref:Transcriptional regulator with XRE-family HTH domain n=1 Tax=Pseudoteredinibacter isoporae TaxID=570281 RepID=A0A7X0MXK5_9GAMM|nr:helix-turn-helix transcriptional regulator [Pseudoteredinibacter isoporae]MBB6521042.1 transcriptional regulator with XRE-family HTH domain [Pseudoteredinibacter isoporae]NHO86606.1 helix-turn-helix transcriptional regulator [Pseudoteredinibacter isoporae]NIB24942.1 helix-turn-helix transcriptional regulator [Pseudoteredinibacter isoporae]